MGHKGWGKERKTFIRYYNIALKFWDEFNASFVFLYFLHYGSIKSWHLFLKNVEENNKTVHLRLLFTCIDQNFFNIKKHLALKKFVHIFFCIFQTKLYRAVKIFFTRPERIRNIQMIKCSSTTKTWMGILHVLNFWKVLPDFLIFSVGTEVNKFAQIYPLLEEKFGYDS